MHVGVLGPLLVRVNGHDVTPRGQRLRNVFVALLQRRGRPVPAEVLLDLVWDDHADGLSVTAVHTTVSRLRRQLGPGAITSDDLGYRIGSGIATDEEEFVRLVGRAREELRQGDAATACGHLRRALGLWRADQAFADVPAEFADADRARLAELRATTIEDLAAAVLDHPAVGGPAEAYELTTGLIAVQPLRERAHHLAMLAAYRAQRQAEALAIYQDLRVRLRTELGIEPTPAAAHLHQQILRHDRALDARRPTPSGPVGVRASRIRATSLPAPVSPLIGRSAELTALLEALDEGRRLITLVGPGGVGKSRLLVEIGARRPVPGGPAAPSSPPTASPAEIRAAAKGIVYAEMSGLGEVGPDELAEAIAVGHGVLDARRAPLDSLIAALADDSWLVLIDEAEWAVQPLATILRSVLEACARVQIVVTSRIPLDADGELLVPVEPLGYPATDAGPAAISSAPAVHFLAQRLADRGVVVDRDPETAKLLASIARRVDGLPLGLELAAGQAAGRSISEVAALIEDPLDLPAASGVRNARHRTLRETLLWSTDRLDPVHRSVLRRLSVFVGRFDLAAARAVAGSVDAPTGPVIDAIVRSLARDALIHVERAGSSHLNFRLLRTVRDLMLDGINPEELAAAQALHRRWHADAWRVDSVDLVQDVREHLDDYLEALRTAVESRDASTLADLTLTLSRFWQVVGGQGPGQRWIGRVLDSGVLGADDRARVLAQRASLALYHDPELVLADTEVAIPILEATGETAPAVTALSVRALGLYAQGRGDEASSHADRAVAIARTGTPEHLARALGAAALIHAVNERIDAATVAINQGRALLSDVESPAERIAIGSTLALALVNLERFDAAHGLLDSVQPLSADHPPPTLYLLTRGWAAVGTRAHQRALTSFAASIPVLTPHPADRHSVETLLGAGCALAGLGHPSAASALAGALELVGRVDFLTPPALGRAIDRARGQVRSEPWPDFSSVPTSDLLSRFEVNLRAVAPALADA